MRDMSNKTLGDVSLIALRALMAISAALTVQSCSGAQRAADGRANFSDGDSQAWISQQLKSRHFILPERNQPGPGTVEKFAFCDRLFGQLVAQKIRFVESYHRTDDPKDPGLGPLLHCDPGVNSPISANATENFYRSPQFLNGAIENSDFRAYKITVGSGGPAFVLYAEASNGVRSYSLVDLEQCEVKGGLAVQLGIEKQKGLSTNSVDAQIGASGVFLFEGEVTVVDLFDLNRAFGFSKEAAPDTAFRLIVASIATNAPSSEVSERIYCAWEEQ
jgi:hypothetical protein